MKVRSFAMACAAILAFAAGARAQTPADEVLSVVTRLFDGMRARDTAMIRSTLFDDVKLTTTGARDGKPVVRTESMDGFLQSVAKATAKLDEKIISPELRVEDNLATVWTRYEFYVNDEYSHCGIDAFQLARTESGWKITTIADTRRQKCN